MKGLSRQQIKIGLLGQKDTTLKYDGTTKKLGHLVETEEAIKDSLFLLGVNEQVSGKANSYADTIKMAFEKVENTPVPEIVNLDVLGNVSKQ